MPQSRKIQTAPTIQATRFSLVLVIFRDRAWLPARIAKIPWRPRLHPRLDAISSPQPPRGFRSAPARITFHAQAAAHRQHHACGLDLFQVDLKPLAPRQCHRVFTQTSSPAQRHTMPAAKATRIHNAGKFHVQRNRTSSLSYGESANGAAAEQPSPYETSEGTNRISALLSNRNPLWQTRQGHAPR